MANIVINYAPRTPFLRFHNRTERWANLICHRRAGKTVAAINDLQKRALECTRNQPRFAFMAPTRVRAKDIAWQYLKYYSVSIPGRRIIESELSVEYPNGARVTLYGADNDRAMGLYLDGIVYDECDEIMPSVHSDVVRPALGDRGGWAVWMGILRGRHNLWKRYEEYKNDPTYLSMMLKASDSGIIEPAELNDIRKDMGESAYLLQMEGNVNMSLANSIYGAQMDELRKQNRIRNVNADPSSPMYTFWDIGHSDRGDDTVLWLIQFVGRDINILDYYARTGHPPGHYAAKVREWEDLYKGSVACNYLPHDGARRNQVGKTMVDYLKDGGLTRIKVVPRTPNLWDSINVLRTLLPRMYINHGPCSQTWRLGDVEMPSAIDCLDYYSKKEDASTGIIKDIPVHDQYSHGCDGLRTMAESFTRGMIDGTSFVKREKQDRKIRVITGPGVGNKLRGTRQPNIIR